MEEEIGEIEHFFNNISVAAIRLMGTLHVNDTVHIVGATTDFIQPVSSMEIERQKIVEAHAGQSVGIKTIHRVRNGDIVYKIIP